MIPFGLNRMVYIIKNGCREVPSMPYEDGATTLFLYTKGTESEGKEDLGQLLRYLEYTTKENAINKTLQDIHQMVSKVKQDGEVSLEYMKIFEREEMLIEQGIEQGREEEKKNTERERKRAELAEEENLRLREEIKRLKAASQTTDRE